MFKFRKYIASLSILGISVQSIFGYSIFLMGAWVIWNQLLSPSKIDASGSATFLSQSCENFTTYFAKINYYKEISATGGLQKHVWYVVSGIPTSTGAFQWYFGTGGNNEYTGGTIPVNMGNSGDGLWAEPEGGFGAFIQYPDSSCTPTLTYDVTPLTITGAGITRVQTITSNYGACTGVIFSRSWTLYTSTGAQTINDSYPLALSITGYYRYPEPFPSQPGDYWDIDVTVDGVGICAGRTVTRKHVSKVPQLTFTAQNATITTPWSQTGRIYDVTSQNGICSDVEFTYSDGSPMTSTGVPYNKEDGMISVPTGTYTDVTVTATATGANCSQSPRLSVSQTITTDTRTAPWAPTGVSATAGNGQATVSFSPPSSNGWAAVTSYTVTSSPGNITSTSAGSPITVTGLTNGTSYTFTVTATNLKGTSSPSTPSSSVTPTSWVTPVSGVCGTASGSMQASTPSTNLCTTGTPGSVTDGWVWNNYSWSCGGSWGGTSMSCTASHISATQTGACSWGLPANATANAGTGFLQTWSGTTYAPATMSYTPAATGSCSYSCNPGYALTVDGFNFIDTDVWGPIGLFPEDPLIIYSCIAISGWFVTIASPTSTINTGAPRFTGSGGTGVTQVVIYKSGGLFLGSGMVQSGSYSFTSALTLSDGTHTIIVTAKDSLGNSGSTATGTFIVDTLAPTVPTVNPVPNPLTTTTPTFSGSWETGAILEIRSGGTGWVLLCQTTINGSGSWSCTLSSPSLSIGSSSLTFLSRDGVGNMSSTSLTVNVAIPVVSNPISIWPGGGSYTANAGGGNMGGSSIAIGVQNMLIGRESAIPLDAFLTGRRLSGTSEITQDSIIERENFTEKRARLTENVIGLRDPLPSTEVCTLEEKFSNDDLEFTDISTHWARSFIEKLARYWIVRNQESYRPDATMTRWEFLALAMRAVRCNYDSEVLESYSSDGFSDVKKSMTVDKYLGVAQEKWWVEGSGRFRPDDAITRTEAVEMVMNILKPEETNKKIGFLDLGRLKKSTQEMILMAQSFSIVWGKDGGYFDPNSALTRGEAAKIVVRSFVRE